LQTLGANQVVAYCLGDWLRSIVHVRQSIVMKSHIALPHLLHEGRVLVPLKKDHVTFVL
jgi:hypothetical protein